MIIGILGLIFSISFMGLLVSISDYNTCVKSVEENKDNKENIESLRTRKEDLAKSIKGWAAAMLVSIAILIMCNSSGNISSSSSSSKWDSLTDSEKAWYERNYGGGKSQQYRDAIDSYKSSH